MLYQVSESNNPSCWTLNGPQGVSEKPCAGLRREELLIDYSYEHLYNIFVTQV